MLLPVVVVVVVVVLTMAGRDPEALRPGTAPLLGVCLTAAAAMDQAAWGLVLGHTHVNPAPPAVGVIIVAACGASAAGLTVGVVTRNGWSPSGSVAGVLAVCIGLGLLPLGEQPLVAGN